jgi:tetratricopeptide (TPR) repeat protein
LQYRFAPLPTPPRTPRVAGTPLPHPVTLEQKGKFDEARTAFQEAIRLSKGGTAVPDLAHLDAISGRRGEARKTAESLKAQPSPPSYAIALLYAGLGDKDVAFEWLERAYTERSAFNLMTLAVEPRLDSLREDPRFRDLLRRMNLPR